MQFNFLVVWEVEALLCYKTYQEGDGRINYDVPSFCLMTIGLAGPPNGTIEFLPKFFEIFLTFEMGRAAKLPELPPKALHKHLNK